MNVLDLFSGIGGFSLGLERAGMKTVAFCENDKHCQRVLKKHWPGIPIFDDVKKLKGKEFKGAADVVCGGFPCQDISVAGPKRGLKGERSGLWKEFKRIIEEAGPRYAIIENVANLRILGLKEVISDLWSIGYACEWHIISARSVGAPHLRERVWVIAYPHQSGHQGRVSGRGKGEAAVSKKAQPFTGNKVPGRASNLSDSDGPRLWKPFASEEEKSEWWAKATAGFRDWWEAEPEFCRTSDGLPKGLDKGRRERIKQLGNSVVPFVPELIGREILKFEEEK